jgi:hypothetical protein
MSLELHIIRAADFIRLDATGHFDLASSKAALALLAKSCRKRGINQALLDLRGLRPGPKPVFSPRDLVEVVNTFPEVGFTDQQHLAILYHSDPHKRARLFAFLSTMHGWNVRAFGDYEEALHWLSSSLEAASAAKHAAAEQRVPIRVVKRVAKVVARPSVSSTSTPPKARPRLAIGHGNSFPTRKRPA